MNILNLTSENFDKEVLQSDKTVLVDFWASWCMPCKMMSGIVEEIANEMEGKVKVGKAVRFGVMSIPTFLIFKNGKVAEMTVGVQEKEKITKLLK